MKGNERRAPPLLGAPFRLRSYSVVGCLGLLFRPAVGNGVGGQSRVYGCSSLVRNPVLQTSSLPLSHQRAANRLQWLPHSHSAKRQQFLYRSMSKVQLRKHGHDIRRPLKHIRYDGYENSCILVGAGLGGKPALVSVGRLFQGGPSLSELERGSLVPHW